MQVGGLCVRQSQMAKAESQNTLDAGTNTQGCSRCPAGAQCKPSDCDTSVAPRSPNAVVPPSAALRVSSANYVLRISLGLPSGTAVSDNYKLLLGAEATALRKADKP